MNNKNLLIRVLPCVRKDGEIHGYSINTIICTPDNLDSDQLELYNNNMIENQFTVEELQNKLGPTIKVISIEFDGSEECEPIYDIVIENPNIIHSAIKDMILNALNEMKITQFHFGEDSVDDCRECEVNLYLYFEKEYIDIIEMD